MFFWVPILRKRLKRIQKQPSLVTVCFCEIHALHTDYLYQTKPQWMLTRHHCRGATWREKWEPSQPLSAFWAIGEVTWPTPFAWTWDVTSAWYLNIVLHATCRRRVFCAAAILLSSEKPLNPKSKTKMTRKTRDEAEGRQFPDRWLTEYSTSRLSAKKSLFVSWHLSEFKNAPFHTEVSRLSQFYESRRAWKVVMWRVRLFLCESTFSQYHESENEQVLYFSNI